jgi:hypothetical protein
LVGKRMCRSQRIEKALALAVGASPEDLFPDFQEEGAIMA